MFVAGCDDRGFEGGAGPSALGSLEGGASTTLPGDGNSDAAGSASTSTTFAADNLCRVRIRLERDVLVGVVQYRIDDTALNGRPVLRERGTADCKGQGRDVNGKGLFAYCGSPIRDGELFSSNQASAGFRGPQGVSAGLSAWNSARSKTWNFRFVSSMTGVFDLLIRFPATRC